MKTMTIPTPMIISYGTTNSRVRKIVEKACKDIYCLSDFYINLFDVLEKKTGYDADFLQDIFEDEDNGFDITNIEEFIQITLEKDW